MIKGRPTAYMKPYYNGYFFLGRAVTWRATDDWGNHVASASTRKECEAECRRAGYTPISDTELKRIALELTRAENESKLLSTGQ